jgi:glycosyltransferase involved in cell wall biosynthesis
VATSRFSLLTDTNHGTVGKADAAGGIGRCAVTTYEGSVLTHWNEQRPQGWRSLRIAMIGQKGLPATFGGIEHHVEEVGRRLAERGHHVTVFCRRSYSKASGTSYRGMRLRTAPTIGTKHLDAIVHSGTSTALAMAGHFDVLHYHGLGPGLMSPIPRFLSGAGVVQTVHGLDHQRGKWGVGARTVLGSAHWLSGHVPHRTVVVSRALGESYQSTFDRTCDYIPNGVDEPAHLPPRGIVDVLGLEPGRYLLFVGRFVPEKAPDLLLRAYRRIAGELPLVMVGDSSFTDQYTAQLKELAAGDPRVRFTGFVYGDLLSELYRYAQVFIQPSLLEGLPLTLLEAASYARPIVASDIAPHREVLGELDGVAGRRMFPSGDELALAEVLRQAMADQDAEALGAQQLCEEVRAGYRWDSAVTALERLYLEVLSARRTPGRRSHRGRCEQ